MKTQNSKNYLSNTELVAMDWLLKIHADQILTPKMKNLKNMRYLNKKILIIFHLYAQLTSRLKEFLQCLNNTESVVTHTIKAFTH